MLSEEKMVYISVKQSNTIKNRIHNAIKDKDYNLVVDLMEKNDVDPHEEISVKGYNWTCIHYAAHFNAEQIIEYLLKAAYARTPDKFLEIVNTQSKEGWSALMVCGIYRSLECLNVMLKCGGCRTDITDNSGKTPLQLAEYYGSIYCFERLKQVSFGLIPVNQDFLKKEKSTQFQNDPECYDLLLNGILRPCVYCQSNLGYLKYSKCCGLPMHKQCLRERDFVCRECTCSTDVYGEIVDPGKAFCPNYSS